MRQHRTGRLAFYGQTTRCDAVSTEWSSCSPVSSESHRLLHHVYASPQQRFPWDNFLSIIFMAALNFKRELREIENLLHTPAPKKAFNKFTAFSFPFKSDPRPRKLPFWPGAAVLRGVWGVRTWERLRTGPTTRVTRGTATAARGQGRAALDELQPCSQGRPPGHWATQTRVPRHPAPTHAALGGCSPSGVRQCHPGELLAKCTAEGSMAGMLRGSGHGLGAEELRQPLF